MNPLYIEIPKEIVLSLKMRPETAQKQLKEELAVHLFRRGLLSLGKAQQLAEMTKLDFDKKLRELKSPQHYPQGKFEEDLELPSPDTEAVGDRAFLYQQALSVAGKFKSGQSDIAMNHDHDREEAL